MATYDYSNIVFVGTCQNAFYFDGAETDMEQDSFRMSRQCSRHLIRSKDNKFLMLNVAGEFEGRSLNIKEQSESDCKFNIQFFKNSALESSMGRAVMLYVNKNDKKMVACCNEKNEIYPQAMDLPQQIVETKHNAVFYLVEEPASNKYMFESSMYRQKFLGFEPDEHNHSLKLVLHHKSYDVVDESCEVALLDCK